jgi:hypothetical protein
MSDDIEEEDACDTGGCIAIDASPYSIKLVYCSFDGLLLSTLHARPHQLPKVIQWIRQKKRSFPDLELAGQHFNAWPPGLLHTLVDEFGPVRWVQFRTLNQVLPTLHRARRRFRFCRAALIAVSAQEDQTFFDPDAKTLLDRWKRTMGTHLSFELNPTMDDIPF